jgi:tripartite ATP-independent transporter DctP family solute receptor
MLRLTFKCMILPAVIIFIMFITCCDGQTPQNSGKIILKAADDHELTYPTTQGLVKMAELLNQWTSGRITIKIFPLAQLGSEKETIELTRKGEIDINRVNVNPVSQIVHEFKIFSLPYIFRDEDHINRVIDSEIGSELLEMLIPYGLIGLGYYDSGARSFYNTKKPLKNISDFQDLKIRVQKADIMIDLVSQLGAIPIPLAFEDVYTALKTGVIDGAENNYPSFITKGHYEVAKYYFQDEHCRTPEIILFSKKRWDSLSAEDRLLIKRATIESIPFQRKLWKQKVEECIRVAENSGCIIITDIDKQPFIDVMQPLYQKYSTGLEDWIQRIKAIE